MYFGRSESPTPVTLPTPDRVEFVSRSRNLRYERVVALWQHRMEDSENLPILHSSKQKRMSSSTKRPIMIMARPFTLTLELSANKIRL